MLDLPTRCQWILAGDLNMVENRQDKTSPCGKLLPLQERFFFNDLKCQFGVEDNPRSRGNLLYSWDNLREDGTRILACLDRMYVFKNMAGQASRKILHYAIKGDNP
jgi:hypothetical protein